MAPLPQTRAFGLQAQLISVKSLLQVKPQVPLLQVAVALATVVVQVLPQLPQLLVVFRATQVLLQQPWPVAQALHARPPEPQACTVVPARQMLFWQQPVQPLLSLHLHCPFSQI